MPEAEELGRIIHGGLVTGLPPHLIGRLESPDCQNIDPANPLGAKTRLGSSQYSVDFTTGSGYRGVGIFPWTRNNGTTYVFAAQGTTIYSVDSGSWFSVQTGMATDSFMQGCALNNVAVITASGLAPKVSSAGSTLANLSGLPASYGSESNATTTLSKYCAVYAAKVWLGGDPNNLSQVLFSKSNSPEDYTTANNAGNIVIEKDDGDIIQGLESTRRALYIFKRKHTYAIFGFSPFDFRVDLLCSWGLVSEWGHCSDGQGAFFASDDGIYYANGLSVSRISDPVRDTYANISDKSTISMEVRGEKLFVFYKGSGASENNLALVLAFKRFMEDGAVRGVWAQYSSQPYQAARTGRDSTLYALTNASTAQIWKLDTGTSATVTARFTTPDLAFGDLHAPKTLTRFYVMMNPDTATTTVTLTPIVDGVSTGSTYTLTFGTSASYAIQQVAGQSTNRLTGRMIRMQMEWTGNRLIYGWRAVADVRTDAYPRR